ncbi:MAG TPA: hypothetical protein VF790_08945 [Dissulfurispiraceae bacterium]
MKGKKLLFVTYHNENFEEGLSYAIDLAKTMSDGIEILTVYRRKVFEKVEDMMTAVAFAEAGEHKTARELIEEDYRTRNEDYESKLAVVKEKCAKAGVELSVSAAATDAVSAIRNILRQNTRIDMVLLSPSVTNDGNITPKELNRLVKTASRPVVTMARNAA